MKRVLAVRLDSLGDVVMAGPAVRAIATRAEPFLLTGPRGAAAARLLPHVQHVSEWDCPWIGNPAAEASPRHLRRLERLITDIAPDEAVIFTSFHQSPLPLALELRLCGVPRITALSEDYPGSLIDVRVTTRQLPWSVHEVDRALGIAAAAGFSLPADDDGLPALAPQRHSGIRPTGAYVVVHPGADAPARAWPAEHCAALVELLAATGMQVVVTGGPDERALTARVAGSQGIDLGGRTSLPALVDLLEGASVVVAGNTGPAHLAAATRTPVVSLFAPVVPPGVWKPRGAPVVVLGDQTAACSGTRARICPIPGHPCLSDVRAEHVLTAVRELLGAETGAVA
ncbi:glycosyltransferase family 9 protein [Sinomonas notoginsengisoli]|uniref:glycosyltransferase family 9 protein n=1 Tax=Sinomonas notoginsengisoli TaxID=1457311 RepID=UPI001F1B546D|nr:glycosyltransferase family 9 protein [Sinomonas notoginsengisoli]